MIHQKLWPYFLVAALLAGCASPQRPIARTPVRTNDKAFIVFWGDPGPKPSRVRLAIKDLIDVRGEVTTAGSGYLGRQGLKASDDAACLKTAYGQAKQLRIDLQAVGKTNLNEFAFGCSGKNLVYGTPTNPCKPALLPGGSSSGTAVSVAEGVADVGFGTDTAGSIRCPATCCGIAGLKTTFGLISLKGVFPLSPKHLDTVGPLARNVEGLVTGMQLLKPGFPELAQIRKTWPNAGSITVGRLHPPGNTAKFVDDAVDMALRKAGVKVVNLDSLFPDLPQEWKRAKDDGRTIALADAWVNDQQYLLKFGVEPATRLLITAGANQQNAAQAAWNRRVAWQKRLDEAFKRVDFIALPTLQRLPLTRDAASSVILENKMFDIQNTVAANFAGNPALTLPVAVTGRNAPVGLELIGPFKSEAKLLAGGLVVQDALHALRSH